MWEEWFGLVPVTNLNLPDGIDPKYILGGQDCLWTESVPNDRHAGYMKWLRSLALSEVFWSPENKRNRLDFISRMEWLFKYMDAARVKYTVTGNKGIF